MAVNSKPNSKLLIGIIDIETGKIISKTSSGKTGKDFYDVNQKHGKIKKVLRIYSINMTDFQTNILIFVWSAFWFTKKLKQIL